MSAKKTTSTKTAPVSDAREDKPTQELAPMVEAGFWERFSWRDFWCYGALWIVIFFAFTCIFRIGGIISEQRRQINELIDRLNQYEDYSTTPPFDREDEKTDDLTSWVKKNLPAKGIEERPAVAEVFGNLADMLDAGTLTGENDTFSEGIAQLQPVATRSVWLPFLSKLTKRLKAAKLDSAGLADACRKVSRAIYLPVRKENVESFATKTPLLLLEGVKGGENTEESPENPTETEDKTPGGADGGTGNPSLIPQENAETKPAENEKNKASACPNGNCPVQNTGYGYRWF